MMDKVLAKLLDRLRERQSWCPYCGGEYTHDPSKWVHDTNTCVLNGLWFPDETSEDET